ncbi:hypothetical protein BH10PSE5_BH10PSE5_11630 [soil metagenome]
MEEEVAGVLGIPLTDLVLRTFRRSGDYDQVAYFGGSIQRYRLLHLIRRLSPEALRLSPHHRVEWQVRPLTFCPETWEYLIDQCPACRKRLGWTNASQVHLCGHCSADLRSATSPQVPAEFRQDLELFAGLVHHEDNRRSMSKAQLAPELQTLSPSSLFELGLRFCSALESTRDGQRSSRGQPSPAVLAEAVQLLCNFPGSLERFAASSRSDTSVKSPFFSSLVAAFYNLEFDPHLRGLVHDLVQTYEPIRAGAVRLKALREARGRLTLTEAAAALKIERDKAGKLADEGAFGVSGARGHSRTIRWLDADAVENVRAKLSNRLSARSFERSFGLPHPGIEQCVSVGHLEVFNEINTHDIFEGLQLNRRVALGLIDQINSRLRPLPAHEPYVALVDMFHGLGNSAKPWASVLSALLSDRLPDGLAYDPDRPFRIDQLLVSPAFAVEFLAGEHPDLTAVPARAPNLGPRLDMTRGEVERHLNCFPRDVTWLIQNGSLAISQTEAMRAFAPEAVERLAAEYISSREILRRWRVSPTLRDGLEADHGIRRVLGPFWPRASVERHFEKLLPHGRPLDVLAEPLITRSQL